MRTNYFNICNILHFADGMSIPVKYADIVADMKYAYYNTKVDWQLRFFYMFYREAIGRLKERGYLTDSQTESLYRLNYKMFRERLQY